MVGMEAGGVQVDETGVLGIGDGTVVLDEPLAVRFVAAVGSKCYASAV